MRRRYETIMFYRMFFRLFIILFLVIQQTTFCLAQQITATAGEDVTLPCTSVTTYPVWIGPEVYNGLNVQYNNPGSRNFANPRIPPQKKARLDWDSDNKGLIIKNVSVADEGLYECSDTINIFVRAPPSTPLILNTEASSDNTLIIRASQSTETKLVCVSTGGYPEPRVEWYRASTGTQPLISTSTVNMGSNSYNVTKTYTFSPQRQDDGVKFICQSSFQTEPKHTSASNVELVLNLKPNNPTVVQTSVVSVGNTVEVRCTTTGSRPAANITWSYQNTNPTGEVTTTFDDSTQTYIVVSLLRRHVTAEDNGQSVQCKVSHTLLVEPPQLIASVKLNVRFSAKASTTRITGNQVIVATGSTPLTLTCTTGSSNPASDIVWKNKSVTINNSRQYNTWTGENNGITRSQELVLHPTRYMDGNVITCSVSNVINLQSSINDTATLSLNYRPLIKSMSDVVVAEGNKTVLTCTASSKPASTFKWYRDGQSGILHQGTGTLASNKLAYKINNVRRTDAATYRCNADNSIETADNKNVVLIVYYPPDVTPVTTNTSVQNKTAVITCNAEGMPDTNYRYGQWEQRWLGYNDPVTKKPGSEKLLLTELTYEHSGVYTCSASNGIKVFDTEKEIMKGSVYLLVKSFPIITYISEKTSARLKENVTFEVYYYSNLEGSAVKIYRTVNTSRQKQVMYSVSEANVEVNLPVFERNIKTVGTRAQMKIQIHSKEDLGFYAVNISNEIGFSTRSFEIVPKGPPGDPYNVSVDIIQYNKARLSWIRGYHGGFAQTFVIQLSTDLKNWKSITVFDGKNESKEPISKDMSNLHDSTTYYIQMYAFNSEGNSSSTENLNFTTPSKIESVKHFENNAARTAGVVGGVIAVVVVLGVIVIVVIARRKLITGESLRARVQNAISSIGKNKGPQPQSELELNDPDSIQEMYEQLNNTVEMGDKNAYEYLKADSECSTDRRTHETLQQAADRPSTYASLTTATLNADGDRTYENLKLKSAI